MADHIALFVIMHPASQPAQSTLLTHLRHGAREYYRKPSSQCSAWSYLSPLEPSKDNELILAGLEIYTSKNALREQLEDTTFFQPFEEMVKRQKLCAREGVMLTWYLVGGFLSRVMGRGEGGGRVVVTVNQLACFEGEREGVVQGLKEFSGWCRKCEPGVLTFAVFTRKKAEREALVYVRYRDEGCRRRLEEMPEWLHFW